MKALTALLAVGTFVALAGRGGGGETSGGERPEADTGYVWAEDGTQVPLDYWD